MPGQWGRSLGSGFQPKKFPPLWHLHSERVWSALEADARGPSSAFRVAGPLNRIKSFDFQLFLGNGKIAFFLTHSHWPQLLEVFGFTRVRVESRV